MRSPFMGLAGCALCSRELERQVVNNLENLNKLLFYKKGFDLGRCFDR